ncbi:MAG: cob(I)yrinic acid a,c-diamide adenosyltransferase [Ruminococcaceae bacterium]|nr:cob(I)yrinic acid a,c-diamide adenosyltransferase [Oscillospiraceae bacterium]
MIYTKKGDEGYSGNFKNTRYPKDYVLFDLLGTIDELSSHLGLAKTESIEVVGDTITALQKEFILLMGSIAGSQPFDTKQATLRLEKLIDAFSAKITRDGKFTISGQTKGGAHLDVARTVARRVEREAVRASKLFLVKKEELSYFNRLSDLLYVLARYQDQLYVPKDEKIIIYDKPNDGTFNMKLAENLCQTVISRAREMGVKVVCAVCDGGGNLMAMLRDDDAYIASINVAQNKAYTAVSLKMPTETLAGLTKPGDSLYGIQHQDSRLVVFGGGIPLIINDVIVGGFGVSGGSLEQDTALAAYAKEVFQNITKVNE